MPITETLIDSGPIIAYYNKSDRWHTLVRNFFETFKGKLVTTEAVATEVMWLLANDWRVQNEFLHDLQIELFTVVPLNLSDFAYIAKLNEKFKDLPGDFADLSIVALSERLSVDNVVSLDSDFDIYRAYGRKTFQQLLLKT